MRAILSAASKIAMFRPDHIDTLHPRVGELPRSGPEEGGAGHGPHLRAAAIAARLGPLDLVSRHEFEVQRALLFRTRAQLTALARRVVQLEAGLTRRARGD